MQYKDVSSFGILLSAGCRKLEQNEVKSIKIKERYASKIGVKDNMIQVELTHLTQ